jgi:hypothetical protein
MTGTEALIYLGYPAIDTDPAHWSRRREEGSHPD